MDPYSVLGISPDASAEEAEEAYRRRLLREHPDLHASGGADAVARAEARTRHLNEAIRLIRHGTRARAGGPDEHRPRRDWFGYPVTPQGDLIYDAVPCPLCGDAIRTLDEFDRHVSRRHPAHANGDGGRGRVDRWIDAGGLVPLWLVGLVNLFVGVAVYQVFLDGEPRLDQSAAIACVIVMAPTLLLALVEMVSRR
jgi:hypothetical protein